MSLSNYEREIYSIRELTDAEMREVLEKLLTRLRLRLICQETPEYTSYRLEPLDD